MTELRTLSIGVLAGSAQRVQRTRRFAQGREIEFPPVRAQHLKNVMLLGNGALYKGAEVFVDHLIRSLGVMTKERLNELANEIMAQVTTSNSESRKVITIDTPVILAVNEGSGTWGHWLVHTYPSIATAKQALPSYKLLIPASYYGSRPNFGDILKLSGFTLDDIILARPEHCYAIKECVIADFLYYDSAVHPAALDQLRLFVSNAECSDTVCLPNLFVRRTTHNKREITNHDDVATTLRDFEFIELELGSMAVSKQISAWRSARKVATVLGSDLTNIIFGRIPQDIIAITPEWFYDTFFMDLAAALGVTWNEYYTNSMEERRSPVHASSFSVNTKEFRLFLETCCG